MGGHKRLPIFCTKLFGTTRKIRKKTKKSDKQTLTNSGNSYRDSCFTTDKDIFEKKMKIALIGYGKMGKTIEQLALNRTHEIALIIDKNNAHELTTPKLTGIDIAIEFSTPETALDNYKKCFDANVSVVSGTTGWLQQWDNLTNYCESKNQKFFYASNFSIGVNIFFKVNHFLAKIMATMPDYNAEMIETHHIHKLDAPSGTAISLAEQIIEQNPKYNQWENRLKTTKPDSLPIISHRENEVPGTHLVRYFSGIDNLEILHEAKSREGFALGAVIAAEYLHKQQKSGCYSMNDMLDF